jgi:iron complex outermembrane receptor protein
MRPILIILLFVLVHLQSQSQCVLRISGLVKDADTRQLLEKATVTLVELKRTVTTDSLGKYNLLGLCPGDYTLRITHADCQTAEYHFHIREDVIKDFELTHEENVLKEVVVVGSSSVRSEGMSGELKGRELAATRGLTLGESLQRINGVTVLQTGNNIYKPVIQGLHSSRVLILNNGIRQEGQQWGSEHAPEIDPFVANRLTVIKGASSIRYGGDAIGGVILVEPRLLRYNHERTGEINFAAFSNNRQAVLSAQLEGAFDKKGTTALRLQATAKRGGNARTPDYWMKNSGVEEINASAAAGWRKQDRGIDFFYSIFNTRIGIFSGSHIGNLTDLENIIRLQEPPDYIKNATFSYAIDRPYQQVQHQLVKLRSYREYHNDHRISLTLSSQFNNRKEFDITRSESSLPQLELDLFTNMADLVWEHYGHDRIKGSVGINAMHQMNSINYRYFVPNYRSLDLGAWAAAKYQLNQWQFELGLRYDNRHRYSITDNDKSPYDRLMGNALVPGEPYGSRFFSGLSGTALMAYRFSDYLRGSIIASTAWRSPQINELFSNGLHHGAARIERGDPDLRAERAFGVMGSLIYSSSKWEVEWGVYQKEIDGFIYLKPGYPPLLTIRGAFPVFDYAQTLASLTGTDVSVGYDISAHWKIQMKGSLLRAFDKTAKTWLIQMPADRYETELSYVFTDGKLLKQPSLKIFLQHVTEQKRVPPTGNIKVTDANGNESMQSDYLPPPPAYTLVNLEVSSGVISKKNKVDLVLGVTNLFNVSYRDYMNAFRYFALDRGRNISVKLKFNL